MQLLIGLVTVLAFSMNLFAQAPFTVFEKSINEIQEALEKGLVTEVTPEDKLLERAEEIAADFVEATSSLSVTLIRQMLWKMLGADHPMEAHKIDSRGVYSLGKTGEASEGVMSFLEKREPNFPGKVSKDLPEFYPWWDDKEFK